MSANIFFLYGTTVIIWGTTWLAIKFQLGSVDPMVSVLYRFIAAALTLVVYCKLRGLNMRFRLKDHIFMALQGLVLFSVNYWLIYLAEVHVTSGLVAVIFSSIVFMNMINGAVFLNSPIRSNVVLGGGMGVVGIVLVFWPQLASFSFSDKTALGLVLSAVSTFMAHWAISFRHVIKNIIYRLSGPTPMAWLTAPELWELSQLSLASHSVSRCLFFTLALFFIWHFSEPLSALDVI